MMGDRRIDMRPEQPGYYVLRNADGSVVDQGEDRLAEFCCRAREIGPGANVHEEQHPTKPGTPFGFHYSVTETELRELARFWKGYPNNPPHVQHIVEAWADR
jgi:hypothetical protein